LAYLKYRLRAKTAHDIHSPFVFDLYNEVLNNMEPIIEAASVEAVRKELLEKNAWIDVNDLGTGKNRPSLRKFKDIARFSVSNSYKATLLYKMAKYFMPHSIIELGTSFGISTMYMALALPQSNVYTIEGCSQTLSIAESYFERLQFKNIFPINANFNAALKLNLEKLQKADFIYFDGNHAKEATLKYFNTALPFVHNDSVFIFDDINQSQEMNEAWETIISNKKVTCSINLFQLGVVFFKKELTKQDFILKVKL